MMTHFSILLIFDTSKIAMIFLCDQGSISPTYLRTAFTLVAPKSVRIQSSCRYLFTLLGSTGAKAARRTLMKLTLGHFFLKNILFLAMFLNLSLKVKFLSHFPGQEIIFQSS
jgi:hypothetical protein